MTLADEYRRQLRWRDWATILDRLPPLAGRTVLDLGCGVGDLAAALAERGAHVIGVEIHPELLDAARARGLADVEILDGNLRDLPQVGVEVDGVWASFVAAYFVDLPAVLPSWARHLKSGGWIALTEVDNLFGHEPLGARARDLFEAYARDAFLARRYDFFMGRKLSDHLTRSGFVVSEVLNLRDRELSFDGPASGDVIDAWRSRVDRMGLLRDACGVEFEKIRDDFLRCLADPGHRSVARVCCCLATTPLRPRGS